MKSKSENKIIKKTKSKLAKPLKITINEVNSEKEEQFRKDIEVNKWYSKNNYEEFRELSNFLHFINETKFQDRSLKFFISQHVKMDLNSERIFYDLKTFNTYNNNKYETHIETAKGKKYLYITSFSYKYGIVLLEELQNVDEIYFDCLLTLDTYSTIDLYRIFKTQKIDLEFAENSEIFYTNIIKRKNKIENIDILETINRVNNNQINFEIIEKNNWVLNKVLLKNPDFYQTEIEKIEDKKALIEKGYVVTKNSPKRVIGVLSGWLLGFVVFSSILGHTIINDIKYNQSRQQYIDNSHYPPNFANIYNLHLGVENDYFTYKNLVDKSREKFITLSTSSNFIPNFNEYITNISLEEENTIISGGIVDNLPTLQLNYAINLTSINPFDNEEKSAYNSLKLNISAKEIFQDTSTKKYWILEDNVWKLRKDMIGDGFLNHITDFRNKYKIYLGFKSTSNFEWKLLSLLNETQNFGDFQLTWIKSDTHLTLFSHINNNRHELLKIELI